MTTHQPQVDEIFWSALQLTASEQRAAYLDLHCGQNSELRGLVEQLLRAQPKAEQFLERPLEFGSPTCAPSITEGPGTQIGPYKLLQQVGEGGMGVVYMAEQHEPVKRRVALKIIKPGMDTRQVIARFEAERQALSLMDHPNIAKVLDAGATESGRPYFVMELVKGQPITQYCDEHHLTPRQRLELLLPVCQAIQHAHQKGIIHRDIKPTNILIAEYDQQPVPKVIDFGVAKATSQTLTEKTMFTGLGQIVGTLEYMSPEQAKVNQLDIDTRSDIYSLGVLLYELLTGSTPFDRQRLRSAAFDEMLRIIREEEPPKPSTRLSDSGDSLPSVAAQRQTEPARLTKLVRGELDWIVMKALEKERNRRYETASGLAADLQRYLNDEQVQACPPSAGYRFRKFTRRNKGGMAVAALVLFFLVLLGSGAGWAWRDRSARQAEAARQQGERQAKAGGQVELIWAEVDQLEKEQKWPEALAAARRAEAVVAGGDVDTSTTERVHDRLRSLDFIDRLEQVRVGATWAGARVNSAGVDRDYAQTFREFGVDIDALSVETAVERLKSRPALAIPVAAALDHWSRTRWGDGKGDYGSSMRLVQIMQKIDPDPLRKQVRGASKLSDAKVTDDLLRIAESIDVRTEHSETVIVLHWRLLKRKHMDHAERLLRNAQRARPGDFWINFYLAQLLGKKKDYEGAIRFYTAAVTARPQSNAALNNLGLALKDQNKLDEAVATFRRALEIDPNFTPVLNNLGVALRDQNKLDEAVVCYRRAIELEPGYFDTYTNLVQALYFQGKHQEVADACRKAIELNPKDAKTHYHLGRALSRLGNHQEAVGAHRKAIELDPKYADAYIGLGIALDDQKKLDEAIAAYHKAIELDPKNARAYNNLGNVLQHQKKLDQALAAYRTAIEIDPKYAFAHYNLGRALQAQKKLDEAIASYQKAIELDPKDAEAQLSLGDALRDQNKLDQAIACYRKAIEIDPQYALAYFHLGVALRIQKKFDEAVTAYKEAIKLDPKNADTHINLGALLCDELKQYDQAIECFRKAIELDPGNAHAYSNLGTALNGRKQWSESIDARKKALAIDPQNAGALNGLAWFMATCPDTRFRDPEQAVALAKKAIELAPQHPLYPNTLGAAYYRTGDWKAAIAAFDKSMELRKGGESDDWFFLAMAHWQLGEKTKATEFYDRAVLWMETKQPTNEGLLRFRAEAAELLGIEVKKD